MTFGQFLGTACLGAAAMLGLMILVAYLAPTAPTISVGPEARRRIEVVRCRLGLKSRVQTVRRAMALLDLLSEYVAIGCTVWVEGPDGTRRQVAIEDEPSAAEEAP